MSWAMAKSNTKKHKRITLDFTFWTKYFYLECADAHPNCALHEDICKTDAAYRNNCRKTCGECGK